MFVEFVVLRSWDYENMYGSALRIDILSHIFLFILARSFPCS